MTAAGPGAVRRAGRRPISVFAAHEAWTSGPALRPHAQGLGLATYSGGFRRWMPLLPAWVR
ncbi:hypothetical protein ACIHCQ_05495 [Streptomyces sp. NPDC052236]|uniref:hypothetical protein n=1 Tax=Streptomyces sp. NPDC052236 TaxID=3365686 RepID=UPI0037D8DE42